ncbi:hypothetical protein GH714_001388 [Hevea brasiliensis]|uniref:Serine aminopeptidase S33 domain-containing protein n=1 Tax=Hevea brasiliensis TaxID=3981 RepID=A0A6A6LQI9_HEVBR|nr:hypothetical protein GH714_001388 [Hevea brasiliensis]
MAHSAQSPVPQQEKVIIPNKHGEKLVGLLHDTGSKEIVVLCHGFRSTKENETMVNLAVALENEGISAFRFDFAGNGEVKVHLHMDLIAILDWQMGGLKPKLLVVGEVDGNRNYSFARGQFGAPICFNNSDISSVVNVSGRYDLNRGIEERLGKDFYGKDQARRILLMVFTVHGSADEIIPVEDALEFAKIISNHKLHIIEGANHSYTSHQAELSSAVLNFIKETLKQDKGTPN